MRIMKKSIAAIIMGVALLFTGCSNTASDTSNTTDKSEIKSDAIEAYGTVKTEYIENIGIDFPAKVANVKVKEGEKVKKNDTLVELDLTDYKRQIEAKKQELSVENMTLSKLMNSTNADQVELKEMQKNLATLKELYAGSDPNIKKYASDIKKATDVYENSLKNLESLKILYESGGASKADISNLQITVNSNKKDIDDLKLGIEDYKMKKQTEINELELKISQKILSLDKVQSGVDTFSIKIQKEKISSIEKELNFMNQKLAKSYIKADNIISVIENGIVSDIGYVKGDHISTGNKLLSILDLNTLYIEANVAEEFIKDVKVGAEVEITPVADRSKLYKGKVRKVTQQAHDKEGDTTITVEIDVMDKEDLLMPNYNVDLKIKI